MIAAFMCDLCDRTAAENRDGRWLCHAHLAAHILGGDLAVGTDKIVDNLNARVRREVTRRIKIEQELDALRAAAKQVWDDLMITHKNGSEFKDVTEESVERLGSILFIKGIK